MGTRAAPPLSGHASLLYAGCERPSTAQARVCVVATAVRRMRMTLRGLSPCLCRPDYCTPHASDLTWPKARVLGVALW